MIMNRNEPARHGILLFACPPLSAIGRPIALPIAYWLLHSLLALLLDSLWTLLLDSLLDCLLDCHRLLVAFTPLHTIRSR